MVYQAKQKLFTLYLVDGLMLAGMLWLAVDSAVETVIKFKRINKQ